MSGALTAHPTPAPLYIMEGPALKELSELVVAGGSPQAPKSKGEGRLWWDDPPLSQASSPPTEAGPEDQVCV